MSKQRILEIYLTTWNGAKAFLVRKPQRATTFAKMPRSSPPTEAARLAVMLPRPRYYEVNPQITLSAIAHPGDRAAHGGNPIAMTWRRPLPRSTPSGVSWPAHLGLEA